MFNHQLYHGIYVAVKEFLPHSVKDDVKNEAKLLAQLCHPYLPYLFGVTTESQPYRIVMQFHGLIDHSYPFSLTVHCELHYQKLNHIEWLIVCSQLLEAMDYLHNKASILHNDIKSDNVVIGKSLESCTKSCTSSSSYQILLVDFGKACKSSEGKAFHLTCFEQEEHRVRFPHIAPEIIEGESKQTTYSDMFSVGGIIYQVAESQQLSSYEFEKKRLAFLAEKCGLANYHQRFSAQKSLSFLEETLLNYES